MRRRGLKAGIVIAWSAASALAAVAGEAPLPPKRPGTFPDIPLPPDVPAFAVGTSLPAARTVHLPLLAAEAKARGLPVDVADAVARIESGYNSAAVGGDGERGMMQVMPPTAALLGFRGTAAELAEPATNIRLGVAYLADAWKLAGGDLCRTLMKYRAGHNQERMSALSVEYCRRAKAHLATIGSPLAAGALPAPEFGSVSTEIGGAQPVRVARIRGRLVRLARPRLTGSRFWAAHSARIKAIEARLPWKKGILAGT